MVRDALVAVAAAMEPVRMTGRTTPEDGLAVRGALAAMEPVRNDG